MDKVKKSASKKKQQQQQQQKPPLKTIKTPTENDTVLNANIMITICISSPIPGTQTRYVPVLSKTTKYNTISNQYNIVRSALPLPN